jgi:hypothetical protein
MAGTVPPLGQGVGGQLAMTTGNGPMRVRLIAWSTHGRGGLPSEDPCRCATA